jgi:hypothetical protein
MAADFKFNGSKIRCMETAKRYKGMESNSKFIILMGNKFLKNPVKLLLLSI